MRVSRYCRVGHHACDVGAAAYRHARCSRDVPPVMVWHLKHNRALHKRLFVLTVDAEAVPWVEVAGRLTIAEIAPNFWRASAHYCFMERPDIPTLLRQARAGGCGIDLSDITYYVGHETVIARDDSRGLPKWLEALLVLMRRNSAHVSDYFRVPSDAMVEIGRQVSI